MNLFDDVICIRRTERLLKILALRKFAFGYVNENIGDLKYVINVRLNAVSPFLHFVLVTCDLRPSLLESFSLPGNIDYSEIDRYVPHSVSHLSLGER